VTRQSARWVEHAEPAGTDDTGIGQVRPLQEDRGRSEGVRSSAGGSVHRVPRQAAGEIWLDLDATDDPLHGNQEGRFFHGYYGCYCYLPLYIFCGEHLLCARLRPSNQDGATAASKSSSGSLRRSVPLAEDTDRDPRDSGFCREAIMRWCEGNQVNYLLGWP